MRLNRTWVEILISTCALVLCATLGPAQSSAQPPAGEAASDRTNALPAAIEVGRDSHGFYFRSPDGRYRMALQARLQFRFAHPRDADPTTFNDFSGAEQSVLKINRARLKVGGNVHRSWLLYYFEYELAASNLLDFRVTVAKSSALRVKVGQWKVQYNRERVISSGTQQLVDRSHINRPFTVDRQQGVSLFGRLHHGDGAADLSYWLSVFTGTGRGSKTNDDTHLMWMGRAQWNALGRVVDFSGSDLKRRADPALLLALAAVTNRSPYTRFSQDGGGQLEGFEPGEPGQYRVHQALLETAFKLRGFSWQQELHWKEVNDRKNGQTTTLRGNYVQLGFFPVQLHPVFPEPLELAFRHSIFDPDRQVGGDLETELSLAANWFMDGHHNKLSAEVSHFDLQTSLENVVEGFRFRLQWDISM